MWGWILLRSPHQGRGSAPAPAPLSKGLAQLTRCICGGVGAVPNGASGWLIGPLKDPGHASDSDLCRPTNAALGDKKSRRLGMCLLLQYECRWRLLPNGRRLIANRRRLAVGGQRTQVDGQTGDGGLSAAGRYTLTDGGRRSTDG